MTGKQAVLKYLKTHKRGISNQDAMNKLHVGRLSSVILRLRQQGYEIDTDMIESENEYGKFTYARYRLVSEP